jgi:Na+/H+ antiporter NhaD/arsenite permease-like protein
MEAIPYRASIGVRDCCDFMVYCAAMPWHIAMSPEAGHPDVRLNAFHSLAGGMMYCLRHTAEKYEGQIMVGAIVVIFMVAYALIALEHPIKINKGASALLGAGLLWTVYAMLTGDHTLVEPQLRESVGTTAGIVFFLIGAMTIVEVIDAHNGFEVITSQIRTRKQTTLIWIVCFVTFFLSAVLDNLTTTIVMISLMKKLSGSQSDRLFFAAMIVIAANAGGAWSVIGDVTTTMLWIGGQITPLPIIKGVFLPSLINLLLPLFVVSYLLKGKAIAPPSNRETSDTPVNMFERNLIFYLGLGLLIAVPAFKTITLLPPFMGILFGLGILWVVGELIHRDKGPDEKKPLTLVHALKQIDMASIVFFIGILLAVATLEHAHVLEMLAKWLDRSVGRQDVIVVLLGLLSAIVDNVPLVAASMGMYSLAQYPPDSFLWEFIAYCAGTGGSILIIGSAAGVAAMGLEQIHFFWYVKRISGLALLGYFGGSAAYIVQFSALH